MALSAASIQRRFLTPRIGDPARVLSWLGAVDGVDRIALGACHGGRRAPRRRRCVRLDLEPSVAELAVTVLDAWHRRGVGTLLAKRLAEREQTTGIGTFRATMGRDNRAARALLARLGDPVVVTQEGGVLEAEVALGSSTSRWSITSST